MKIKFNTQGNDKQFQAFQAWNDPSVTEIVYGGAKGGGKSYLGCALLIIDAIRYPKTRYFIARSELKKLRQFTLPTMKEVFQSLGVSNQLWNFNAQDNFFKFWNKSEILFLDAKYLPSDPDFARFGSMQFTRGFIEEAGEMQDRSAKVNLQASLGRVMNQEYNIPPTLLMTCNPSKNFLYRDYYKPFKSGDLPSHARFIQALVDDNRTLGKAYKEQLQRTFAHDPASRERLLLGNWEYDDNPLSLIEYGAILAAFETRSPDNSLSISERNHPYITCDVARFGKDKTVIGVWKGWKLIEIVSIEKSDLVEVYKKIEALRELHRVRKDDVVIDENGIGGGVIDMGKYKGFVSNARPVYEVQDELHSQGFSNYPDLGTQCGFGVARMISEGYVDLSKVSIKEKGIIIEELEQVQRKTDDEGKLRLLPKSEVKKNLGRSPDYWDMLKMRFFFTVNSKNFGYKRFKKRRRNHVALDGVILGTGANNPYMQYSFKARS